MRGTPLAVPPHRAANLTRRRVPVRLYGTAHDLLDHRRLDAAAIAGYVMSARVSGG